MRTQALGERMRWILGKPVLFDVEWKFSFGWGWQMQWGYLINVMIVNVENYMLCTLLPLLEKYSPSFLFLYGAYFIWLTVVSIGDSSCSMLDEQKARGCLQSGVSICPWDRRGTWPTVWARTDYIWFWKSNPQCCTHSVAKQYSTGLLVPFLQCKSIVIFSVSKT